MRDYPILPGTSARPGRGGARPCFTAGGVRYGMVAGQPLAAGILAYGIAFGALAAERQLSSLEAVLMSALVYSGSAQLAALQFPLETGFILPIAATVLMMNARYLLYGAALRPWLAPLRPSQTYGSLLLLGDGNWALAMKQYSRGERDAGFLLGSGAVMFAAWIAGTAVGQAAGSALGPTERLALDFLLPAFAAALAFDFFKDRGQLVPAVVALAAAACVHLAGFPAGWAIVAAGLAGGATAAARAGRGR